MRQQTGISLRQSIVTRLRLFRADWLTLIHTGVAPCFALELLRLAAARGHATVAAVAMPMWWTGEQTSALICLLLVFVLGALGWAFLKKKVRQQTDAMRGQLQREQVISELGRKLATAVSVESAARI